MSEMHWFANICSEFSISNLDKYLSSFGMDSSVEIEKLLDLGFLESADWLKNNEKKWNVHKVKRDFSLKKVLKKDFEIIYWGEERFPENLKTLSHPPPLLFCKGIIPQSLAMIAVVGARSPTEIGRMWVQKAISELTNCDAAIVSGGARGIDAEAHFAALESGLETIAFLPGSVDRPYPHGNSEIFQRILSQGCLLSEYPPGTEVRKENFHRRNRLIAGLADIVVIVEAAEKSGTLMTAGRALAENRDIVVVPGPPLVASYEGSLRLIYEGAGLARDAKDIILALERKNVLKLKEETPTLW